MFIRSAGNLQSMDRGIQPANVLAVRLSAPEVKYPEPHQIISHIDGILAKLAALPFVHSVAAINELPAVGYINWAAQFVVDGRPPPPPGQEYLCHVRIIGPACFQTMGITLLEGRDFSARDRLGQPRVIVVNRTLAEQHYLGQPAVGQFLKVKRRGALEKMQIVGVVGDVRQVGAKQPIRPAIYFPYTRQPTHTTSIVLRTSLPAAEIVPSIRSAVDDQQALYSVETVQEALAKKRFWKRPWRGCWVCSCSSARWFRLRGFTVSSPTRPLRGRTR